MTKHLLTITELSSSDIAGIFAIASRLKKKPFSKSSVLKNKVVGLIFEKPSNRTRVSFEAGIRHLGGTSVYLGSDDIKFGVREPVKDIARTLSRYVELMVLRTFRHEDVEEFADYSTVPVINGLSDLAHPCQALTDIFTIGEKLGSVRGKTLAYVGDGNNVLYSLMYCAAKMAMHVRIAMPARYSLPRGVISDAGVAAKRSGGSITVTTDPSEAVKGADVIYTDVWVSMGQEAERKVKMAAFKGFQVNRTLVEKSGRKSPLIMHCLPAHRGEEIAEEVLESPGSIVFDEAENRLHIAKAIMVKLVGDDR
ncbi:MAG: ornithine carbamoyltransferase [Candidatus Omnitrophica bacterium]|nr:ornithine carbamoyltransferase [Candidatus Omnitrophota bacterium]